MNGTMLFLILAAAYLAGSVNFSIIVFRLTGRGDPRDAFSGNPGMTNVYRQCGLPMAALVLILDVTRSMLVAALALHTLPGYWVSWIGFGLIFGNRYPCFHGFRGGKGVANYLGFILYIAPLAALVSALVWLMLFACFRIPFIGSFGMVLVLAAATVFGCSFHVVCLGGALLTAVFIMAAHRQNILNLK